MLSATLIKSLEQLGDQDASTGSSNWQHVAALTHAHPDERLVLLQWVFQHYPGLYDPRHRAGEAIRQTDENRFWMLVADLFRAKDANDRLFALDVLDELHNEQHEDSAHLHAMLLTALHILPIDPDPLVRITAAHLLHTLYPDEVHRTLHDLLTIDDARSGRSIRDSATKLLGTLNVT